MRVDAPQRVIAGRQTLFNAQQQNLIELGHRLGGPVIAPHEHFADPHGASLRPAIGVEYRLVAKGLGHRGLQVKHQPIFPPASQQMQAQADQAEQGLIGLDAAHLEAGEQALIGQLFPAAPEPGRTRHPHNDLQVAQAARRLFAIGLQRVGRVFVLGVPLAQFQRFGHEKGLRIHLRSQFLKQSSALAARARHESGLEQRGLDGDVPRSFFQAFSGRAHARADLQATVPAQADEGLQPLLKAQTLAGGQVGAFGQKQQDVHIGVRKQLTPAIAADGHQAAARPEVGLPPQLLQHLVGVPGEFLQQPAHAAHRSASTGMGQQRRLALPVAVAPLRQLFRAGQRVHGSAGLDSGASRDGGGRHEVRHGGTAG